MVAPLAFSQLAQTGANWRNLQGLDFAPVCFYEARVGFVTTGARHSGAVSKWNYELAQNAGPTWSAGLVVLCNWFGD